MNAQPQTLVFCIPLTNLPVSQDEPQLLYPPMFMPPLLSVPNDLPAPAALPALAPAVCGRIEGKICKLSAPAPITNASLFLIGPDDAEWLAWDITIDHGTYAFAEVKPGDYSLTLIWDQSGRFQDELDEIVDFGWEDGWLVSRGRNGVVVATACLTVKEGEALRKDWNAPCSRS